MMLVLVGERVRVDRNGHHVCCGSTVREHGQVRHLFLFQVSESAHISVATGHLPVDEHQGTGRLYFSKQVEFLEPKGDGNVQNS